MKRSIILLVLSALILLVCTACIANNTGASSSSESNEQVSSQSVEEQAPTSNDSSEKAEDGEIQQEEPISNDTEKYQLLAVELIEQYKNNSIEVNDTFPALPEGFEFPDNLSAFEFQQNEMGYFVTSIIDKNNTYEMFISIDDMTYDGVKPEENPHVDSVFFNKIV